MPKRNRTKSRHEDVFSLAMISHQNNWPWEKTAQELEKLIDKNADLLDEKAKSTARSECKIMADPALKGWLPKIQVLTQQMMDAEPPGTSRRFQHEFLNICRYVRKTGHLP